ncbi:MAG: hypothetical protein IPI50_05050 [Saprospiraceae bacterium]|nr:hypothetical protein [Saprospiraceae bacterium]
MIKCYVAMVVFFLSSCGISTSDVEVISFRIADSTFQANTAHYFKEADSLCGVLEGNKLNYWIDSLLAQRREEVNALRR